MIKNLHLNSKQLGYAAIQSIYMILGAAAAALLAYLAGTFNGNQFLVAVLVAAVPALQRVYKGWEDGVRAAEGDVLPRDVGAFTEPLGEAAK